MNTGGGGLVHGRCGDGEPYYKPLVGQHDYKASHFNGVGLRSGNSRVIIGL